MVSEKEIFFSDEMLKIYGCVNCIWKGANQCPKGFKSGTGSSTENGYCDKLTDFFGVLAEGEDSVSAVKEKFHLFIQEIQVLEDRKRFIELQQQLDKAREGNDFKKVRELDMGVNSYKLWWHRLTTKRIELKLVRYDEADELLIKGWELAKEEDTNQAYGLVYLELRKAKND